MANIILPRKLTQELRQDTINAYNILLNSGKIDKDCMFRFAKQRGHWGLEIWKGSRDNPIGGVAWVSCVDVITAADKLPIVRGLER